MKIMGFLKKFSSSALGFLKKLDSFTLSFLKWVSIVLFIGITGVISANILVRHLTFLALSINWLNEITELLFAGMIFFGAAAVWILKGHFSAGEVIGRLFKSPVAKGVLRVIVDAASLLFILVLFRFSIDLVAASLEKSSYFQIPKKINYIPIAIGAGIMTLYSIKFIAQDIIAIVKPDSKLAKSKERE